MFPPAPQERRALELKAAELEEELKVTPWGPVAWVPFAVGPGCLGPFSSPSPRSPRSPPRLFPTFAPTTSG